MVHPAVDAASLIPLNPKISIPRSATFGISIIAVTKNPSPKAVSRIPCICGQMAAARVIAMMAAAGRTIPPTASGIPQPPASVAASRAPGTGQSEHSAT